LGRCAVKGGPQPKQHEQREKSGEPLAREIRQAVEELHPAVSELVDRDKLLRLADQAADAAGHARSDPNFGFSVGRSLRAINQLNAWLSPTP